MNIEITVAAAAERDRTRDELNRTKYGDSLTRYDPPLDFEVCFEVAETTVAGSLVGYELHLESGKRILVGHVNEEGSDGYDDGPIGHVVAGRKAVARMTGPTETQDRRKTSPEKLERIREIANDMIKMAAREPQNDAFQKMTIFAEKIHRTLDGDWD